MNKVLLVGRLVRDPAVYVTSNSNIKYTRLTIAVNRTFNDNQADFIPAIAWGNQSEFTEKYLKKGMQVSVEGRFSSSNYIDREGKNVTNYEVTVERITGLESKAQVEAKKQNDNFTQKEDKPSAKLESTKKTMQFEESEEKEESTQDVPWEIDL